VARGFLNLARQVPIVGGVRRKRRNRRIWIAAVATVGLAGGVYAAEEATAPPQESGDELARTIATQKINEGQLARPVPVSEHQVESFTPDQMLNLADKYGKEMKTAGEHAENLRILAYRSRDLIRMTCVDDKLTQIMVVIKLAEPRIASLAGVQGDPLVLRQHFSIVQQAHDRVAELALEAEQCMGDTLSAVSIGRIKEEEPPASDNVFDPTRPPAPTADLDRPAEASPYR
jgi:hypothetical protein